MSIKDKWMRIRLKYFPSNVSNEEFCDYLRNMGISIGKGTFFFEPSNVEIDTQRPWMVSIGEYCKITKGVIILQHDYSRSVLRRVYGDIIAESKETVIGNNVFIGMNSIILMGSHIGDNVIIGASSVVTGDIPDNSIIAGNPAKVICSLDDYYNKRCKLYVNEAIRTAYKFEKKFDRYPSIQEMGAFFPLFGERSYKFLNMNRIRTKLSGDDESEVIKAYLESSPIFEDYTDFLEQVKKYRND